MDIRQADLKIRVMAWTGLYETSQPFPYCHGISAGNFDNMGVSYGVLQWNLGKGSLQPIFQHMVTEHREVSKLVLGSKYLAKIDHLLTLPRTEQIKWGKSITEPANGHRLKCPWNVLLANWGETPEMVQAQLDAAKWYYWKAKQIFHTFGLWSQRGYMLAFDIAVQNGGISKVVKEQIFCDFRTKITSTDKYDVEVQKMQFIALRRAKASNPRWADDVKQRKLTIASGRGKVHGHSIDGAKDFNISLIPVKEEEI